MDRWAKMQEYRKLSNEILSNLSSDCLNRLIKTFLIEDRPAEKINNLLDLLNELEERLIINYFR